VGRLALRRPGLPIVRLTGHAEATAWRAVVATSTDDKVDS
jgi:hypothetical protein